MLLLRPPAVRLWSRPSPGAAGASRSGPDRQVRRWWRAQRGSATVELTLVTPLLVLLLVLIGVLVHRGVTARLELDTAAHQAARTAALARTLPAATTAARAAAHDALTTTEPACSAVDVTVDTSRWRPGGAVAVTVSCALDLTALGGLPGHLDLTATATEPLDTFRATDSP